MSATATPPARTPGPGLLCPLCREPSAQLSDSCARCGGDLTPLAILGNLADHHFNRAVAAARTKDWEEAAEHLAVSLALRPDDVEAIVLLGKARFRRNRRSDAAALWGEALRLEPGRVDVQALVCRAVPAGRPGPSARQKGKER